MFKGRAAKAKEGVGKALGRLADRVLECGKSAEAAFQCAVEAAERLAKVMGPPARFAGKRVKLI